jgi:hypothetical protein
VNDQLATSRGRLEREARRILDEAISLGTLPSVLECRKLQDELDSSRRLPGVPGWFYVLTRRRRQGNMGSAARSQIDALPSDLTTSG